MARTLSTTKAIVLARGLGTRMRADDAESSLTPEQAHAAAAGVKALMPIGDGIGSRPFLDYVLSALADAGFREVCLVIGPEHDAIRHYYGQTIRPRRLTISFAVQAEPRGTADAVAAAEEFAGDDPFVALSSDNYFPVAGLAALRRLRGPGLLAHAWDSLIRLGNIPAERVRRFGLVRIGPGAMLAGFVEKPTESELAALEAAGELYASMAIWRFTPRIFEACRRIPLSPRGELELPTAVMYAIEVLGEHFHVIRRHEGVLDLSSRGDVGSAAAHLAGLRVRL